MSSILLWNDLDLSLRSVPSISIFKHRLKTQYKKEPHFLSANIGRKQQVMLTQIRLGFSNLCSDLYKKGCCTSPKCKCGYPNEDATNFLLSCPIYVEHRSELMNNISIVCNVPITPQLLLFGSQSLSISENENIMEAVCSFIDKTERFSL